MTSFFKHLKNNLYYNREQLIKENLISQLGESVKEIQLEYKEKNEECLDQTDSTSTLCTILEAIFLHGLKDSLLWKTISVISGNDVDRKPEPNFWPLLLVFLHAQTIVEIENLTQIKSDIGNCRAWIRLSLNESLFSSYLKNIRKNSSALNPYYKSYAFLKDSDLMDIASKILEGLEAAVQINLYINSTLLNQWTVLPLQLSGLYTPPLRSCPIASGIDVASSLNEDTDAIPIPKPLNTNELFSNSISNSPFNSNISLTTTTTTTTTQTISTTTTTIPNAANIIIEQQDDLNEEDNVKLLLDKIQQTDDHVKLNIMMDDNNEESNNSNKDKIKIQSQTQTQSYCNSNSINSMCNNSGGWSDDFSQLQLQNNLINDKNMTIIKENHNNKQLKQQQQQNLSRSNSNLTSSSLSPSVSSSLKSPPFYNNDNKYSYNALLVKHQKVRGYNQELDLKDVWQHFQNSLALTGGVGGAVIDLIQNDNNENEENQDDDINNSNCNLNQEDEVTDDDNFDFEILPKLANEKFTLDELQKMVENICKLAREHGLDAQGYMCKGCSHPLGIGFANAHVCSFSGSYYCEQCMSYEQFIIPSKVIYNWDFRKYNVSKRAAIFMTDFQHMPFIDLKMFNPKIYEASDEMAMIQSLRIQLNFIRAYFYTCCESSIQALKKQINSKDYLYEHIHQYSIADLIMIPKGQLMRQLQKTYQFGEDHILNCNLCSVKGFFCEICKSPKVLYPFHINTTFRCELCSSVFHDNCLDQSKPCPKCKRKREREDLPLLEAVHLL